MIEKYIGQKVLAQTSAYFVGPDGKDHNAIWGTLNGINKVPKELGFIPNRNMANWYYEIGDTVIMGCQINYMSLCPDEPKDNVESWGLKDNIIVPYITPHKIFITK